MGKKKNEITIRSSAAEYLTFIASTGDSKESYEMRYENENIWLTQKMMAALYGVSKQTISQHIQRIYDDGELLPEATVKKYLTVQVEGRRQVSREMDHYSLQLYLESLVAQAFPLFHVWSEIFKNTPNAKLKLLRQSGI